MLIFSVFFNMKMKYADEALISDRIILAKLTVVLRVLNDYFDVQDHENEIVYAHVCSVDNRKEHKVQNAANILNNTQQNAVLLGYLLTTSKGSVFIFL